VQLNGFLECCLRLRVAHIDYVTDWLRSVLRVDHSSIDGSIVLANSGHRPGIVRQQQLYELLWRWQGRAVDRQPVKLVDLPQLALDLSRKRPRIVDRDDRVNRLLLEVRRLLLDLLDRSKRLGHYVLEQSGDGI